MTTDKKTDAARYQSAAPVTNIRKKGRMQELYKIQILCTKFTDNIIISMDFRNIIFVFTFEHAIKIPM